MKYGILIFVLQILICLVSGTIQKILKQKESSHFEVWPAKSDGDWRSFLPASRKLSDDLASFPHSTIPQKEFKVKHNLSKLERKLKFMQIVHDILRQAKKRHLQIQSIKLGPKIKRIFKNKMAASDLNKFINDKKLNQKLKKIKQLIKSQKISLSSHTEKQKTAKTSPIVSKRKLKKGEFNFDPNYAGMPFPPFLMNGPHYHPPMNVTVNAIPDPNPRVKITPVEIEEEAMQQNVARLKKIAKSFEGAQGTKMLFEDLKSKVDQFSSKGRQEVINLAK